MTLKAMQVADGHCLGIQGSKELTYAIAIDRTGKLSHNFQLPLMKIDLITSKPGNFIALQDSRKRESR